MRRFIILGIFVILKLIFSLRYRWKVIGFERLKKMSNKPGGILFLPNHPSEMDPVLINLLLWPQFMVRSIVVESSYYLPGFHHLIRFLRAIPIPGFDYWHNSFKNYRADVAWDQVKQGIRNNENFLIYPSGALQSSGKEVIGGASGVYNLLQEFPETNIVLVRTTGFWGSLFSRALTGNSPYFCSAMKQAFKILLKNFIFFIPKRNLEVEFFPVGNELSLLTSRHAFNKYLGDYYNRPYPDGEPLNFVSYAFWKELYLEIKIKEEDKQDILKEVPEEVISQVKRFIAEMTHTKEEQIDPSLDLAKDLLLDSLDIAQIVLFLNEQFGVKKVYPRNLGTVAHVIAVAAKLRRGDWLPGEQLHPLEVGEWNQEEPGRPQGAFPKGKTILEAFLNTAESLSEYLASLDKLQGPLTYHDVKIKVILLAKLLKKYPEKNIGILLPASTLSMLLTVACWLAGKIPVHLNWTLGPRHLDHIVEKSEILTVFSSFRFLDRLHNVELGRVSSKIVLIEDMRHELSFGDLLKARWEARYSAAKILRNWPGGQIQETDIAVLLSTSGTEGHPKLVPLTHKNLLHNQRGAFEVFGAQRIRTMLCALPPFHSLGFVMTGIFPLISGLRSVYCAELTNTESLLEHIEKGCCSLLCLPPFFLMDVLESADRHRLRSVEFMITGGEKAPKELYQKVQEYQLNLIEGYGATECAPIIALNPIEGEHRGVGKLLPGVDVKIVDPEKLEPLAGSQKGLILVSGENVFGGYYREEGRIHDFLDIDSKRWYCTGDIGFLDEEGYLTLCGRQKRFAKIGGEMISLVALEEVLYDFYKRCFPEDEAPLFAIVAREQKGFKTQLCIYSIKEVSLEDVNCELRDKGFSSLIRIQEIKKIAHIPINAMGKVQHHMLETRE